MEEENLSGWWGNLSEVERARIYEQQIRWLSLPPMLRRYYNAKQGFYMRTNMAVILFALAIVCLGIAAYFFERHPWITIIALIIGFGLGVVFVWSVERK